jgi:hypothetical protein
MGLKDRCNGAQRSSSKIEQRLIESFGLAPAAHRRKHCGVTVAHAASS